MKVYFDDRFYENYSGDPAAAAGRMEAIVDTVAAEVELVAPSPASLVDISAVHSKNHINHVRNQGLYEIAALAAGGALAAAETGLSEPSFGLIRPPGHHASAGSAWGFCFFNNMAIALESLKRKEKIQTAFVLDFDLHFGDGNVNILGHQDYVNILNPESTSRDAYLEEIETALDACQADTIAVSAGFDNHMQDWGGLLTTDDYRQMGKMVRQAAQRCGGGYFGILEGGYNHAVLGQNVLAFIHGLKGN